MYQQHWSVLGGSGLDVAPAFGSPFTCFVAVLTVNLVPLSEIYYPVLPGSLGKAERDDGFLVAHSTGMDVGGRNWGAAGRTGLPVCSTHVLASSKKVTSRRSADLLALCPLVGL